MAKGKKGGRGDFWDKKMIEEPEASGVEAESTGRSDRERTKEAGKAQSRAQEQTMVHVKDMRKNAELAKMVMDGGAIVELDPGSLSGSFVPDRFAEGEEEFAAFKATIERDGQETPILVRPLQGEDAKDGRKYHIVFGHRRARAAKELGRKVKAIVRDIDDEQHVVLQGQENSARDDLTFIEKAVFARRLTEMGYGEELVERSLSINGEMRKRMVYVTDRVREEIVDAVGKAEGIGRDRWVSFGEKVQDPANEKAVLEAMESDAFGDKGSKERFSYLLGVMTRKGRSGRNVSRTEKWNSPDKAVTAEFGSNKGTYSISLKSKEGREFGKFISDNLERLHEEFLDRKK